MTRSYPIQNGLSDIPVPHDCVIERIRRDGEYLLFEFEQNIADRDSARFFCPTAKSLIIRYRLMEPEYTLYRQKTRKRWMPSARIFRSLKAGVLFQLPEKGAPLAYLSHYIANGSVSMLIVLSDHRSQYILELPYLESVEYDWIE